MKVAVLFDNLGPYHLARLTGAAAVVDLLAVESAGASGEYEWLRSSANLPFRVTTLFPGSSSGQVAREKFAERQSQVLSEFKPDVVVIPGWSSRSAFLAMLWCLRNRVPVIVMSESTAYDEVRSSWREWIKRQYIGLCSAALVGGSPHTEYMVQLGMKSKRIFQGYDAVDNDYFALRASESRNECNEIAPPTCPTGATLKVESRNKFSLPENYFLASARFIPKKNLSRLMEAYARYRELFHQPPVTSHSTLPWSLVLLGDGELRPTLETQLLALHEKEMGERSRQTRFSTSGFLESVQMPGFIQYPELPIYYGLAGAFIHASTSEQWGLVVNEAMASGLPVLVSNRCGCAPDLVKEGVNGYTFDPTDVEQLAALMFELSTKNSQFSTFGSASQRIIGSWGPERFAAGLQAAAKCALEVGPKTSGFLDRLLLRALSLRS